MWYTLESYNDHAFCGICRALIEPGGFMTFYRAFIAVLLLLASCAWASHASEIYVWKDEHGVVHMRDKKPDHMAPPSRMEQRERYLQEHPEAVERPARAPQPGGEKSESRLPAADEGEQTQGSTFDGQLPPEQDRPQQYPTPSPQQLMLVSGVPLLVALGLYLFFAYAMLRIGRKFGVGSFLGFCVPIYNVVLLCRCAGFSGWYVLFLFLPIINIFVTFLIWGKIAERLGKNMVLWGLLCTILGLPVLILAFDSSLPPRMERTSTPTEPEPII